MQWSVATGSDGDHGDLLAPPAWARTRGRRGWPRSHAEAGGADRQASPTADELGLWSLVREDFSAHGRDVSAPGFHAMVVHRIGVHRHRLPAWTHYPVALLYKVLFSFVRNVYGIELWDTATVGRRVVLGHQSGIVLHPYIEIGDDTLIRQNVTIASLKSYTGEVHDVAPRLGRRVDVGAGAVLFGKVTVGDDAKIGPGAVVTSPVPAGALVFAPAPRVLTRPPGGPTALQDPLAGTT